MMLVTCSQVVLSYAGEAELAPIADVANRLDICGSYRMLELRNSRAHALVRTRATKHIHGKTPTCIVVVSQSQSGIVPEFNFIWNGSGRQVSCTEEAIPMRD